MAGITPVIGIAVAILVATVFSKFLSLLKAIWRPPLPPGPKGLPVLGNIKDMPQPGELEFLHWLKFKERFGPISSVTVLGQTIIILNDIQLASEILDKRSAKHSSRPRSIFAGEIVGWESSLALTPYGDRFRTYRRHMSRVIGTKHAAARYNALQEEAASNLLLNILDSPDGLIDHIKREAASVILDVSYGYKPAPHTNDCLIDLVGHTLEELNLAGQPGAFLVDTLPFLRFVPDWLPGTRWKQTGKKWRTNLEITADKPFDFVKYQMARGKDISSYVSDLLDNGDMTEEEELNVKWSAMSMYSAGAETTVSSIACFFLLMAIHPEVQHRAQEEIDRVIGQDRLPLFSDRHRLPYVEAIVKEIFRWHPVAPMGLPHTSSEDDVVEGYFIPKDALIFANIWQFTHDASVYEKPMEFTPERFLSGEGRKPSPDPRKLVFGFGRRVCPGRIIADNALFITFARSLATLTIAHPVIDGKEAKQKVKLLPGIITHPDQFQISIKPRSAHHEMMIRAEEQLHSTLESDAEVLKSMGL